VVAGAAHKGLKLLWISCGNQDGLLRISQGLHTYLMVGELAASQSQASDGFVCGIPDGKGIFAKIAADGTVTG